MLHYVDTNVNRTNVADGTFIIIIHGFFIGGSNQKIPKSDKRKKNHLVNIDKSFRTCLV
jgi:hypothetical protein